MGDLGKIDKQPQKHQNKVKKPPNTEIFFMIENYMKSQERKDLTDNRSTQDNKDITNTRKANLQFNNETTDHRIHQMHYRNNKHIPDPTLPIPFSQQTSKYILSWFKFMYLIHNNKDNNKCITEYHRKVFKLICCEDILIIIHNDVVTKNKVGNDSY